MAYEKEAEGKPKRKSAGKLTDAEVVSICDWEFDNASGRDGEEISTERQLAMDYYNSKPLGNEVPGNSSMVTSDVADVVDGIIPSLLRIFCTADNLANFRPTGPEDIAAARQESDTVNQVFWVKNDAFLTLHSWFMDALIVKNGIVKCWFDESEEISTEKYTGLNEQELALLNDDEELEPIGKEEREEEQLVPTQTPLGVMPMKQMVKVYDVEYRRTIKDGRVRYAPVPPEEYRISGDACSPDPCTARFVGHETTPTRSALIEMGYDKDVVNGLPPASGKDTTNEEKRGRKKEEEQDKDTVADPAMEKVDYREAYIHMDYDKDGVAELRKVCYSGEVVLANDECDRQPFHVLTPKPLPHKHFGKSVAELVMDIQKINTTLLRQALDNLYHSNQPGHAVWEQGMGEDTLDDLLTTQTGRVARFTRPPSEAWMPMSIPFTAQHSFAAIEYFDKAKRDRTGITQDSEGLSPEALKNIQTTVLSQAIDVARGKIEAIARIFAETGIKTLLMHIHELMLKHQKKEEIIELRGEYIPVDPREWKTRKNMTVTVGLGMGSKEQNLIQLQNIAGVQKELAMSPLAGMLIKPKHLYNTASEMVRNANLRHPELYFADPGDQEFPPPPQEGGGEQAIAMEMVKVEQERTQLDAQKAQLKAQQDAFKLQQDMADMQATHMREVETLRLNAKKIEGDLMVKMEQIANQLTEMELKYATNVPGAKV